MLLCRVLHFGLLYLGSVIVLVAYAILYGLTAKEAHWLGAVTSFAVLVLGKFPLFSSFTLFCYIIFYSHWISSFISFPGRLEHGCVLVCI